MNTIDEIALRLLGNAYESSSEKLLYRSEEKKKTLVNSCSPDDMNDIFIFKQDPIIKLLYSPKF